jgi:hypothetical protein
MSGGLCEKSLPLETGNQLKQALAPSRNPKLSGQPILAPCYFEMLSFRLINATRAASCMTILFVMELSKHGRDWVRGADIWRALDPEREFMLQRILKFAPILGCLEVERRASNNGNMHHFFRLKDEVQFVDCNGISGRLMTWMLASLTSINCARPKQTPRIGLLLFAIFSKKLVKRTDIDEYLENKNENASVILRHIVSAQRTHVELISVVSQDRVHANERGHYAQRLRDFQIFNPAHPPDLHPGVQSRVGSGVPEAWSVHRFSGRPTRDERQCAAPLAQRASAQRMPSAGCVGDALYPWTSCICAIAITRAQTCGAGPRNQSRTA